MALSSAGEIFQIGTNTHYRVYLCLPQTQRIDLPHWEGKLQLSCAQLTGGQLWVGVQRAWHGCFRDRQLWRARAVMHVARDALSFAVVPMRGFSSLSRDMSVMMGYRREPAWSAVRSLELNIQRLVVILDLFPSASVGSPSYTRCEGKSRNFSPLSQDTPILHGGMDGSLAAVCCL